MKKIEQYEDIVKDTRHKRIKAVLEYPDFDDQQRIIINNFYGFVQRKGLRLESQRAYLQNLKLLMLDLNKDMDKLTQLDINNYLNYIGKYKPKTQTERRKFLIVFFEWYLQRKKEKIDLISDIQIKKDKGVKLPEEILSPDEIKRIVQVADNFRDKALVLLLYETGTRKGEFLQLKIKHIDISNQQYGLVSIPQGKTDSRKLPIIYSVPHIQNWLNSHPLRDNPNAPLFINQGAWLNRAMGEDGLKRVVKILSKRAGIKKRIFPHLFRHSRMTELAKELTEQELKKFAGWTPDSNMASVYVHLSGADVTNKILANAGLIDRSDYQSGKDVLKGIKCPRCEKVNSADVKYCTCGFCLDLKEMNKIMDNKSNEDSKVLDLIKRLGSLNPESIMPFVELSEKIKSIEEQMSEMKR